MPYPDGFPQTAPYPKTATNEYQLSPEKRRGGIRLSSKKGQLVVEETMYFDLISPNKNDSRKTVIEKAYALGLHIPNSVSPDGLAVCTHLNAERDEQNPYIWRCEAVFSSDFTDDTGSAQRNAEVPVPPTAWIPQWQAVVETYEYSRKTDAYDKPYTNGARARFANPPKEIRPILRWDFSQFEPLTSSESSIAERNDSVNEADFTKPIYPAASQAQSTWAKHTLRLKVRSITTGYFFGLGLRLVEYSVLWKEDTWVDEIANVGDSFLYQGSRYPYIYKTNGLTAKNVIDKHGFLGSRDVPLDTAFITADGEPTAGVTIDNGSVFANLSTRPEPYYIKRLNYKRKTFGTFLR